MAYFGGIIKGGVGTLSMVCDTQDWYKTALVSANLPKVREGL